MKRFFSGPVRGWHVLLLAFLLWGGEYVRRGLWEPDEARYAYVAKEMRQDGRWAVLHRHGELYAHKPPLMFWLTNAFAPFTGGVNRVSARLPSLLGGVLALWCAAQLSRRWFGPGADWRVVPILATAYLFRETVGMGQIDALLCGLEMMALYLLLSSEWHGSRWLRPAGAYVCMGLAILAKGPVGLLVPLGVYVVATLATGQGATLRRWHWAWGLALAALFPATWLAWALWEGTSIAYFKELIGVHVVSRAAGGTGHAQGPFYYLWHFPLEFMPWTLFMPSAWVALRAKEEYRGLRRALVAWMLFVVFLFSLSPGKRHLYILFAYPAAAILLAGAWPAMGLIGERWRKIPAYLAMGLFGLLGLAGAVTWLVPGLPVPGWVFLPGGLVLVAAAIGLWRRFREESLSLRWFALFAGMYLVFSALIGALVLPALNPLKTPVALAEAARATLGPDDPLLIYQVNGEILALYSGHRGKRVWNLEELRREMKQRQHGLVVFELDGWNKVKNELATAGEVHEFKMGHKKLVWLEFRAPSSGEATP